MHKPLSYANAGVVYTPWGASDYTKEHGTEGAIFAGTPSHGGMWIPESMYLELPSGLRETAYSKNGWYEEDCDIAIPIAFFGSRLGQSLETIANCRRAVVSSHPGKVPTAILSAWGV